MPTLRVAFLASEYVTELKSAGGLASYLSRMTAALLRQGHEPHVFTLSQEAPGTIEHQGVKVHRVAHVTPTILKRRGIRKITNHIQTLAPHAWLCWIGARGLAEKLKMIEQDRPFDLVQSADFGACGLYVEHRKSRPHVIRCSWASDLFMDVDNNFSSTDLRWTGRLERRALRRADRVYAPSRCVADYYLEKYRMNIGVVRPPVSTQDVRVTGEALPFDLPPRFLIHFGQLGPRKGSDVIAKALPLVWKQASDFTMVWAGKEMKGGELSEYRGLWGDHASKVVYLGARPRQQLYETIARATASVLPSRADNLPNTVIESLVLGVGVIGSNGASIDELVTDGKNGTLVPIANAEKLADAMLAAWRGQAAWQDRPLHRPEILDEMTPQAACANLLKFAGVNA